ncbi:hypothetical protein M0L20_14825 [Spirosoma sp. RP8]|uniref:Uncharacterized protein n=1 Tax=Spirosoma liriopis TaxID=2937440 RepID=A0ABT0HLT5_9BACT|nr:hypothetical protein [Spirosoma liriopis]MCK8493141.1 hypothetical protein [Spirosoma liriopis]
MTNLSTSDQLAAMINQSEESFAHESGISFTIDELRAAVESPGSNVRLPDDSLVEALHDMLDKMKDEPFCIEVSKASLSPAHYGMVSGMFKLNVCMPDGEG